LFLNNSTIDFVIYADYGSEHFAPEEIVSHLHGWEITRSCELYPEDFNQNSWENFWHGNPRSREFGNPVNAGGVKLILQNAQGKKVMFIYLRTDAVQTYKVLKDAGKTPNVIVIQDHGFGGNWTFFGGGEAEEDSPLYLLAVDSLPNYILVGDGCTTPWNGYTAVTEAAEFQGMHVNNRTLYKLKR
jgi:hypothetical protein